MECRYGGYDFIRNALFSQLTIDLTLCRIHWIHQVARMGTWASSRMPVSSIYFHLSGQRSQMLIHYYEQHCTSCQ